MVVQDYISAKYLYLFGVLGFIACGPTGQMPLEVERDSTFDSQQLSSDEDSDDELLEDTEASKPETISGMFLADIYMSCSEDSNIDAPINHIGVGCLAIDADEEEIFDIHDNDNVKIKVASGKSKDNPEDAIITVREDDEKEDYEKNYWSMTMIAPAGQKTIQMNFASDKLDTQIIQVDIDKKPRKEVIKAWNKDDLPIPKAFVTRDISISSLHGEEE